VRADDCHYTEGLRELRLDLGPGYRVYLMRKPGVIVCLCGGDKSTQRKDIARARAMERNQPEHGTEGRESLYKAFAPGAKPRYETVIKILQSLA
jgi:hypothetical protein